MSSTKQKNKQQYTTELKMTVTTGFMRNIAINQYKNVKSTLKIPNNLVIYLTSRFVF